MSDSPLPEPSPSRFEALRARLGAALRPVAEDAARADRERTLLYDAVAALRPTGVLAARVPTELGGSGISVAELMLLAIDIGAADANLAQIVRSHFGFVENLLMLGDDAFAKRWQARVVDGALVGNASSESGPGSNLTMSTTLDRHEGGATITGRKFYSTGSLYADHVVVAAPVGDGFASFVVPRDRDGMTLLDDWDGIGQRLTASGTTILDGVEIDDDEELPRPAWGTAYGFPFLQLELLAAQAGTARRVRDDTIELVSGRRVTFGYPSAGAPPDDRLIQSIIGELAKYAAVAEATVLRAAAEFDAVAGLVRTGTTAADLSGLADTVARAQIVVSDATLRACRRFYDAAGASMITDGANLHRHWRNARTICSHNPAFYRARAVGDRLLNGPTAAPPSS